MGTRRNKERGRWTERGKARTHTKTLGFGPVLWKGVVWKEETTRKEWTTLQYVSISSTFLFYFLSNLYFLPDLTTRHLCSWMCVCVRYCTLHACVPVV